MIPQSKPGAKALFLEDKENHSANKRDGLHAEARKLGLHLNYRIEKLQRGKRAQRLLYLVSPDKGQYQGPFYKVDLSHHRTDFESSIERVCFEGG